MPYFPVESVLAACSTSSSASSASASSKALPVWHPNVKYYEIRDEDSRSSAASTPTGSPRYQRGGAWMDAFTPAISSRAFGAPPRPDVRQFDLPLTDAPPSSPIAKPRPSSTVRPSPPLPLPREIKSLSGTSVAWDFVEPQPDHETGAGNALARSLRPPLATGQHPR